MDGSRTIERMIYRNPILNIEDFPPLDSFVFDRQELESLTFDYSHNSLCYTYIREHKDTWFVDIYYYYSIYYENKIHMQHFIIAPGFQMEERDECDFFSFVNTDFVLFNTRVCKDYVHEISSLVPTLNMKPYKDVGIALFHTYYASFRSGIRELLLKAGLEYIAIDVSYAEGWNIVADNIEDAFGLSVKLLRKLNYRGGLGSVISKEVCRNNLYVIYKKFHSILNDILILNEFQIRYLEYCANNEKVVDKRELNELSKLVSDWDYGTDDWRDAYEVYEDILNYWSMVTSVSGYKNIFPRYPSLAVEDIDRFYQAYHLLREYIDHAKAFDDMMQSYSNRCAKYKYHDEIYEIIIPATIKDILDESDHQHNCLYQSVIEIYDEDMIVVFMRERSRKNKSLITIEIEEKTIIQVKGCCNRKPNMEQMEFVSKFANAKGLFYI